MSKTVIISGASGMDATYLIYHLEKLDYKIIGIVRRNSNADNERLRVLQRFKNLKLVYGDITDAASIEHIVKEHGPSRFWHLAANSLVSCSWLSPTHVIETNLVGTLNCLEAVRMHAPECRFYTASSSEEFGGTNDMVMLNESSTRRPRSPYGVSKLAASELTRVYRESYGMFAVATTLFNHSETLRGIEFFTRKVTSQLAQIKWGLRSKIKLGNLDFYRDEGSSLDYTQAMIMVLDHDKSEDFVIASGETHSGHEWIKGCCEFFGLKPEDVIEQDKEFFRPNEVNILMGDASKAKRILSWEPKISYNKLIERMCQYDYHAQSPDPEVSKKADMYIF